MREDTANPVAASTCWPEGQEIWGDLLAKLRAGSIAHARTAGDAELQACLAALRRQSFVGLLEPGDDRNLLRARGFARAAGKAAIGSFFGLRESVVHVHAA